MKKTLDKRKIIRYNTNIFNKYSEEKIMKKLSATIIAMLMMVSLVGCNGGEEQEAANKLEQIKADGKIIMATSPDWAPYEFLDLTKEGQDQIVGADVELGKYIANELGVELVIEPMDFSTTMAAVTQGTADMVISGLAYKPERAETMELSIGYNTGAKGGQGLMILKDRAEELKTLEDFTGLKIAAQNGSLQHELASTQLTEPVMEPVSSTSDAIMMLISGKVDAVAITTTTGTEYAGSYDEIMMCEELFEYKSEGTRIGVNKGETELIEFINGCLETINEEGLYDVWVEDALVLSNSLKVDE